MTTTTPVDLDHVLAVADELRRICGSALKMTATKTTAKQESIEAALAHVLDVNAGRQPSIRSDGPFYRLLARFPPAVWRWEHLEPRHAVRSRRRTGENGGRR